MKRSQDGTTVSSSITPQTTNLTASWYSDKRRAYDCLSGLRTLYEAQLLCDVTLSASGGTEVACHRAVLAASSAYFRAMFTSHFIERTRATVTLSHVSPDCLRRITHYFYTGDAHIDGATVQPLFNAAHMLQVAPLEEACVTYMRAHINETNCIGVYFFAVEYKKPALMSAARLKICRKFAKVTRGAEFVALSAQQAAEVLSFSYIQNINEEDVYLAAMHWLDVDLPNRRVNLATLLSPIRFALMDEDFFRRRVKNNALFRGNRQLQCVFDQVIYFMNHPNRWHEVDLVVEPRYGDRNQPYLSRAIAYTVCDSEGHTDIEIYSSGLHQRPPIDTFPPELYRPVLAAAAGTTDLYLAGGKGNSGKVIFKLIRGSQFVQVASMHHSRTQFSFVHVDRFLYILGGGHKGHLLNSVEKYNLDKNQWTKVALMPYKLRCACAVSYRGRLYVFGGEAQPKKHSHRTLSAHTLCYDPETDKWQILRSMSTPRALAGCAIYRGKIYVVGGMAALGESWQKNETPADCTATCEVFDPGTNSWEAGPSLRQPLCGIGVLKYYGTIFVLGGVGSDGKPSHEILKLSTDGSTWQPELCQHLQWAGRGNGGLAPTAFSSYAPLTFSPVDSRHSDTESESTTRDIHDFDDLDLYHDQNRGRNSSSSSSSSSSLNVDTDSLCSWVSDSSSSSSSSANNMF